MPFGAHKFLYYGQQTPFASFMCGRKCLSGKRCKKAKGLFRFSLITFKLLYIKKKSIKNISHIKTSKIIGGIYKMQIYIYLSCN